MNHFDEQFYDVREISPAHTQSLAAVRHSTSNEYARLVGDVFLHMPAAFPDYDHSSLVKTKRDATKEELSDFFYRKCYAPPHLRVDGGAQHSHLEFNDAITDFSRSEKRNVLWFLRGEVGIGKTAFINYLITQYGKQWILSRKLWFVRLDVEIACHSRSVDGAIDFIKKLGDKACAVLATNADLLGVTNPVKTAMAVFHSTTTGDISLHTVVELFRSLVKAVYQESGRRLLLFFDNLDYICHILDRRVFDDDSSTGEEPFLESLIDLINLFRHNSESLDGLGANIVFTVRDDSYQVLTKLGSVSYSESFTFADSLHVFDIQSPDWTVALASRTDLIAYASERLAVDGKRRVFSHVTTLIKGEMESSPSLREPPTCAHVVSIANRGLRDLMDFFQQYSWLRHPDEVNGEPIRRIVPHYPVALLTFMLGKKRRFSQVESGFPNIYLVHMPYDKIRSYRHAHSYWLKRLVLEVLQCKRTQGHKVGPDTILDIFVANGKGYEELIVRECLGSMSEATGSNLIRPLRRAHPASRSLQIESIVLTTRGAHCLQHVFDKFFYLQLVVEDHMLPVPKAVSDEFMYPPIDYGYIVADHAEYAKSLRRMVAIKALQVFMFLEILRSAAIEEERSFPEVFLRLRAEGCQIPSVDDIQESIRSELNALEKKQGLNLNVERLIDSISERSKLISDEMARAYHAGQLGVIRR